MAHTRISCPIDRSREGTYRATGTGSGLIEGFFRWPLVFRFIKGAIHGAIIVPVLFHALFTAFVVYLDLYIFDTVGLPSSIVRPGSHS